MRATNMGSISDATASLPRADCRSQVRFRKEVVMPLFMDVHQIKGGVTANDVAKAHMEDVKTQEKFACST
jgi:hypothetical protein